MRIPENRPPTHPGEILMEDFLKPHGMSQTDLAQRLEISFPRVNEIINGRRGITPDTAIRLSRLFGTTPAFWLTGQLEWDLWHAERAISQETLERIVPVERVA
jgi:antitoxin HigA-1